MTDNTTAGGGLSGTLLSVGGAGIVRIEGRCDVPVDRVWSALTDADHLAVWLGELDGELQLGKEFRAHFHATGWQGTGRVEECEPPRRLVVATTSEGEPDCVIEATLTVDDGQTVLVVEDRGLPLDQIAAYGAGDQVLVEHLLAYLAGHDRDDAQARWRELHPSYQELAAALR